MSTQEQLNKLKKALVIAQSNGNQLFISNIERDIAALEAGQASPIIAEYLTEAEREAEQGL